MPEGEIKDIRNYPNSSGNEWGFLVTDETKKTEIYWRKPGKDLPSLKVGGKVSYDKGIYNMVDPSNPASERAIEVMIITGVLS